MAVCAVSMPLNSESTRPRIEYGAAGGESMEKKVLNAMKKAGKPVRPGDVAKMIAAESKDVSKIINKLKKDGKVFSPKRCFWTLSEE